MLRLIPVILVLLLPGVPAGAAEVHIRITKAVAACSDNFLAFVASDEIFVTETFCVIEVPTGPVEIKITKAGQSRMTSSEINDYAALYAPHGFMLLPTDDVRTFRVGAVAEGQQDLIYVFKEYGGVYHFAHFTGHSASWIRCNEQSATCVYYSDLLPETTLHDRWGYERTCSLRWVASFSAPVQDVDLSLYMDAIFSFKEQFAARNSGDLTKGCLRVSQRP